MKTIEEKARAYDKVRKKIAIRFGSNVADEFFAEFEGSKDEEIRKALLEMVHDTTGDELWACYNVHKEEALAWLGKQGQVKESHVSQHENKTCKENNNSLTSEDEKVVIKYGEQKPVDKIEPKFKIGDKIYLKPEYRMPDDDTPIANTIKEIRRIDDKHYRFDGSYIFIEDQDKYELVEQKPEENKGNIGGISANWSEEDKSIIEEVVSYLINYSNIVESKEDADRIEYLIDKIQDICPHQKQAWSEEDERLCQCLIEDQEEFLDRVSNDKYGHSEIISDLKEMYHERLDWLKSLRPQNRWKPNDEQIKVCKEVYADILSAKGFDLGTVNSELNRLEEQLKKLKEE